MAAGTILFMLQGGMEMHTSTYLHSSVQSLSRVQLLAWTAARQASLFITNSQSLLRLMSIALVIPSNHLILCRPLPLSSIFHSIRVFPGDLIQTHGIKYHL